MLTLSLFSDRPDGGDYVYRVQFMQQDDPSKAPLLLGQSGTVTVHVDTLTDLQEGRFLFNNLSDSLCSVV